MKTRVMCTWSLKSEWCTVIPKPEVGTGSDTPGSSFVITVKAASIIRSGGLGFLLGTACFHILNDHSVRLVWFNVYNAIPSLS